MQRYLGLTKLGHNAVQKAPSLTRQVQRLLCRCSMLCAMSPTDAERAHRCRAAYRQLSTGKAARAGSQVCAGRAGLLFSLVELDCQSSALQVSAMVLAYCFLGGLLGLKQQCAVALHSTTGPQCPPCASDSAQMLLGQGGHFAAKQTGCEISSRRNKDPCDPDLSETSVAADALQHLDVDRRCLYGFTTPGTGPPLPPVPMCADRPKRPPGACIQWGQIPTAPQHP